MSGSEFLQGLSDSRFVVEADTSTAKRSGFSGGAPLLALTCGGPGGIGPEITLKAWLARGQSIPPFLYLGALEELQVMAARLKLAVPSVAVDDVAGISAACDIFPTAIPVLRVTEPDPGKRAILAIEQAVALARSGAVHGIVTNPIHKARLQAAGFGFPGHTEFLASLCVEGLRVPQPVMLLAAQDLRVALVTIHQSLTQAIAALSVDKIMHTVRVVHRDLQRRFYLSAPRLVLAALNPHAGEGGTMGDEEAHILEPAIAKLKAEGIGIHGPYPADTLFHSDRRKEYDCAICLYHDQGLIPIKTLDFWGGVNVTLGLPIIRTSPDHGVGYDIEGRGIARPDSLIAALKLAASLHV